MITLELVGGVSSYPFNVTVIPSEQSPVSAEGNNVICTIMCWKSVSLTSGGVDFNTTPVTATFHSGMTISNVSVAVIDDKLAEGINETFHLMLIVPSSLAPSITAGDRNRATAVIFDTTSK